MFLSEIVCSSLPALDNGAVVYAVDTSSPFNCLTTATYSCSTGFALINGARERTCVGSSAGPGEWSGTGPSCESKLSFEQVQNLMIIYNYNYINFNIWLLIIKNNFIHPYISIFVNFNT